MSKGTFYITTPIYYPSSKLHIGNAYCTVATDVMARYKRMSGYDVMFLTGTDEHGVKIGENARAAGITPQEFVDRIVEGQGGIVELWKLMNISNDRFIRTTDDYHKSAIQRIFKALYDRDEIYKGTYKGLYCTPCESFWTETQLVDGKCPDCGREVKHAEEEAYFFRLSKYGEKLTALLQSGYLEPRSRVNEMINNFIRPGLEDLCVSRTTITWGVPVDFDPGHVVYVWVDALFNYMTALGFENDRYDDMRFWPADLHIVGKEIVRFHSIIWPAFLMALDLPLPKKVFGHGWLVFGGEKISKSRSQGKSVIDPLILAPRYGADALRYYLLRSFPFGSDGDFTNELLVSRINSDLANDLGNLVSRTVAMAEKYFGGSLPDTRESGEFDSGLIEIASKLPEIYETYMEKLAFHNALAEINRLTARANKYIDETMPWALARDEANTARLAAVLYNLLESVRVTAVLLSPFMPESSAAMLTQLGVEENRRTWESVQSFGGGDYKNVTRGETLFPRIDIDREMLELAEIINEATR
ncbi:MAG: methionine--tRNA ligase [Oscillospiraceae bacterium]|jgi:methionyl-tRNA synthetase|nr:methionine--tRNA ligase [Oscillospiraceae bacterium]